MNDRVCFRMLVTVSICFHDEALSNNPTRKVAHSLHYPTDVIVLIVSHFSLVSSTTSHKLEGESSFTTKYKTVPEFPVS